MKTRFAAASGSSRRDGRRDVQTWVLTGVLLVAPVRALDAQTPLALETVTIVLPPRLMAGHPATLAVLGADGKLAPAVQVALGGGQTVTTDRTGRAVFQVPASGESFFAQGSGTEVVTLIDPAVAQSEPSAIALPPIVSLRDRFWICGPGLRGNAEEDSVKLNGQPALVLASSPICLVALPGPSVQPGPATVSVEAPGVEWSATTTVVSLEFVAPHPPLNPGQQGELVIRTRGSSEKLQIVAQNRSPGVLRFLRGDSQELSTAGGPENVAIVKVQAISSGDFSFRARVESAPDVAAAERYLRAAVPLAPKQSEHRLAELIGRLAHHPQDTSAVRAQVERLAQGTTDGQFRTLLVAAEAAL
jgi:hypothetical protein